jgi:hypothetical protein
MLARVLRVLIGFVLGCAAAVATQVLFTYAPSDWASLGADLNVERLSEAVFFALVSTPYVVVSTAVPVLLMAALAETRGVASWFFYALAGIATAGAGFLAQHLTQPGPGSILQTYALIAFLTSGLVGGLVYWASSGRHAVRTKPAA